MSGGVPGGDGVSGPLFFHHIPKTAGTSVIRAVGLMTPRGLVFSEGHNSLSVGFTAGLARVGVARAGFIHGHPGWGACAPWRGKARFITLVREPHRQLISHYLHAVRDPALPQHAAARALGFGDFVRVYQYNIPFQTNALYMAICDADAERRLALEAPERGSAVFIERHFASKLADVFAYLDEMLLVGVTEEIGDFLLCLAAAQGWPEAPALPHENQADAGQRGEIGRMLEQVAALERDAALAPLFTIERLIYAKAKALAGRGRGRRGGEYVAYSSELGEVVLGENFAPGVDEAAAWMTGDRQLSRLCVTLRRAGRYCLVIAVAALHFVGLGEILVGCAGSWLDARRVAGADGGGTVSVSLDGLAAGCCSLFLYLEWNRYPDRAPYYPAIRIRDVTIEADLTHDG